MATNDHDCVYSQILTDEWDTYWHTVMAEARTVENFNNDVIGINPVGLMTIVIAIRIDSNKIELFSYQNQ